MRDAASDKKTVLCFCPQCEKYHDRSIYWSGREYLFGKKCIPKIRCTTCNTRQEMAELTINQREGISILMDKFKV